MGNLRGARQLGGSAQALPARRSMPDIRRNREIKCYAAAQHVSTAMRDKGVKERLLSALAPGNVQKIKDGVRAVMVVVADDLRFERSCWLVSVGAVV